MQIRINNEIIEFSIEKEETLGDILQEIQKWLSISSQIISKIEIDGKDYTDELDNKHIDGIFKLDIKTSNILDSKIESIETIHNWLLFFKENYTLIPPTPEIISDISVVKDELGRILSFDGKTIDNKMCEDFLVNINKTGFFNDSIIELYIKDFIEYIDSLILLIDDRYQELTDNNNQISSSIIRLANITLKLENVSLYIQSNKGHLASEIMDEFTLAFQKVIRLLDIRYLLNPTEESTKLKNIIMEINKNLNELLDGFKQEDVVTIGDILEYEIVPQINTLISILDQES